MEPSKENKEDSSYTKSMKMRLMIYFFFLGIINHLGTILVMTGGRILSYELNLSSWMYFYTSASTLFNILTRFINSRYLVHISYKIRITFLCFWMCSGYLIMSLVLISYEKKYISNNKICFFLSLIPSFILGTSYALGESAILAYLSTFPKNLVGGFSSGTGLSGLFSASLNFASQYYPNLRPKALYLFLAPLGPIYLFLFLLTERIQMEANFGKKYQFEKLNTEEVNNNNNNDNENSDNNNNNNNTDNNDENDNTNKNKPMNVENFKHVMNCIKRIILNLFLIYLSQFYCLNGMFVKNSARTDIGFLPIQCSREKNGHTYRSGKYEFLILFYQIGMFTSKSMLFIVKKIQPIEIFLFSILSILFFFIMDYFFYFVDYYFFIPLLFELGFLGGGTYVAAFYSILSNKELGLEYKDISVNCATIANDFGTFLSGIIGYLINNSIFKNETLYEKYIKNDTLIEGNNCCNNDTSCPYKNRSFLFDL